MVLHRSHAPANPGTGQTVVDGFGVDGTDHDTLRFKGADCGTTPAGQLAGVLAASRDTAAGPLITDPTPSSPGTGPSHNDTLLLNGVSEDTLGMHAQQDIALHARDAWAGQDATRPPAIRRPRQTPQPTGTPCGRDG